MNLQDELLGILDALNAAGIKYALCGGMAVALYGYPRFTKDIDLLVKSEDLDSIKKVLKGRGFNLPAQPMPFEPRTKRARIVHRISKAKGKDLLTIDLIVATPVLEKAWETRETFEWQGRRVGVVSKDGLALMKRLAGRDQDLLDLKMLGLDTRKRNAKK